MIRPGRGVADRPSLPMPAYVPPSERPSDGAPARGIAVGMLLSVPVWFGLAALAWWVGLVTIGGRQ